MREGYRILDADRHVIEPVDIWEKYLEPAFRGYAPYFERVQRSETPEERVARLGALGMMPAPPTMMMKGRPVLHKLSERAELVLALDGYRRAQHAYAGTRPDIQLEAMNRSGIDVAFIYPTFATYLVGMDGLAPELARAFARAYNAWLHDFCSLDPKRLRGVGLMSPHDPARMVGDLEAVVDRGWKAVVLRPNPIGGRPLGHPAYEPFWAACERHGIAVSIHEGTHARAPSAGADRFETRFALHACSHPMEQMMALLSFIEGGVLERHPDLRVAFLEAGCGWLPYWLWRLDEVEYRHLAAEVEEHVRREPSAYFRRQCFIAFEPGEPGLAEVLERIGEDKLLFGTDFPHLDHEGEIVEEALALRGRLSEPALRKLLWDNGARFFGVAD